MSRANTVLAVLDTYLDLYSYVSKGRHTPQEVIQYLERQGRKSSSALNHVSTATDGKLPYISYSQEQLCLNTAGLAEELTVLISKLNLDVWIAEKKKKPEDSIPSVTTATSPKFEDMKKQLNAANGENKKLQADLKKKDEEIAALQEKISQILCEAVFTEVEKKTLIPGTVVSNPVEVLAQDIFKGSLEPNELRAASSLYDTKIDTLKELTEKNFIQHVCNQFKDGSVFKGFLTKKMTNSKTEATKPLSDRENAIALLLANDEMDNQTKLTTYALWYLRDDPQMEELLTYAGDYGINANYVIRLLEQPGEQNYRTIRAFLKQALSASEAHIKRQTAQELLRGDWQAVAEYCGKMCHFKLVPVEELQVFKELLLKYDRGAAACKACQMITSGPLDQKLKKGGYIPEQPQIEVPVFVHAADGDVDIHVAIDEDVALEDFSEEEAKADEQ